MKNKKGQAVVEFVLMLPMILFLIFGFWDFAKLAIVNLDATANLKRYVARAASYDNGKKPSQHAQDCQKALEEESFFPIKTQVVDVKNGIRQTPNTDLQGYLYYIDGAMSVQPNGFVVNGQLKYTTTTIGKEGKPAEVIKQTKLGQQICFAVDIPVKVALHDAFSKEPLSVKKVVCALTETTEDLAG